MPETDNSPDEPAVATTKLFGKYELGKLLGCGAFAKVFHARNVQSGESVAIKVINKKKILATPRAMACVTREVSVMRSLDRHPHIVRLLEIMASRYKIYFVLEFVKGGELFAKIAKNRFTEAVSRRYFQQLISAVAYCHSHGVFHRDLKPENLLLDENGDLKVSDFGLSYREDGNLCRTLCGTPAYVAPEILAKKAYDGAKVDVWSCGVILFVLSAGFLPFNDPNLMLMYRKIYKGDYRCPKWISNDLRRLISRLLDTNPETRITMDEILNDPWFRRGGNYAKLADLDLGRNQVVEEKKKTNLNAFDIISFSSGLDLSGLFDDSCNLIEDGKRFVSEVPTEKIMELIEGVVKVEGLRVMHREELGFHLEGAKGEFQFRINVYKLTETLAMVEARRRSGDLGSFRKTLEDRVMQQLRANIG